jgi:hypothetical protein
VNVFADFDYFAAELVTDDDRLITRYVAAVVGQHLISHTLP